MCEKESNSGGESCPATQSACMERVNSILYITERIVSDSERVLLWDNLMPLKFFFYIYFKHFAFVWTDEWPTVVVIKDTSIMAKSDNLVSPHDILATMSIWLYEFSETKCIILDVCRHWDVWLSCKL